jgi:predicted alpha/beta superfamily hydrolase
VKTLICCLSLLTFLSPVAAADVDVEFFVTTPKDTDAKAALYIAGSLEAFGSWQGKGLALKRLDDGRYHAKVQLPDGAKLEYKITRGSWETVEKNKDGSEIPNRQLTVKPDLKVEIEVQAWASASKQTGDKPPVPHTLTGDIRYHEKFKSRHLDNERTLIVYLPPDYQKDTERRYPVLYMHDGQNLFDAATSFIGIEWQADETAERLIKAGRIEPIIMVGIYNNADRVNEYAPSQDKERKAGGKGELYARFLVEEVKPFIDKEYRTMPDRKHTAVAGSSLGGLISLYICGKYPETFSMCGAISPAIMWDSGRILKELRENEAALKGVRFWVDMGTKEGKQIDSFSKAIGDARELIAIFDKAGLIPGRDYYYWEVADGEHNEAAWAARFDKVLLYFFGK